MPLKPEDTLLNGQYRILRQLGRGGYGFVYQAEDTLLHKDVAIKELLPNILLAGEEDSSSVLKRFLSEARATMDLTHGNIVRTHTIFPERDDAGDTRYYIVMAYLPGGSLEELLEEQGLLPIDEGLRMASHVAAALDYAHTRGVVHCDLKPASILRSEAGTYMVADFGIAHVSDQMMSRTWHTSEGLVVGTLPYMSPEQTTGLRDDPRIDVYALGAVLYHALTGETYVDFGQEGTPMTLAENIYRIHNEDPVPPTQRNPSIPAWLDGVILHALRKKPEERMTMAELQGALESGTSVVPRELDASLPPGPQDRLDLAPAPAPPEAAHEPARSALSPKEARRLEKERRRLRALEDSYRRRFELEEQRLTELANWLQHQEDSERRRPAPADELRPGDPGDGLPSAGPGSPQWAAQLRRQIEESVAKGMQVAADWPEDLLADQGGEAPSEFGSRQNEILSRLQAAGERLERSAERHAGQKLVGPALERLEGLLEQAVSTLDIGELPLAEREALAFLDKAGVETAPEPASPLPEGGEPDALAAMTPESAPPRPDISPPQPQDDLPGDQQAIDLELDDS